MKSGGEGRQRMKLLVGFHQGAVVMLGADLQATLMLTVFRVGMFAQHMPDLLRGDIPRELQEQEEGQEATKHAANVKRY